MRYRADVARAACPELLVDTDDWQAPNRAEWRDTSRRSASSACPSLYYATHLDMTGEPLEPEDYDGVARYVGGVEDATHDEPLRPRRPSRSPTSPARRGRPPRPRRARSAAAATSRPRCATRLARRRRPARVRPERVGADAQAADEPRRRRRRLGSRQPVLRRGSPRGSSRRCARPTTRWCSLGDNSERGRGARRRAHVPGDARARRDHDAGRCRGLDAARARTGVAVVEVDRQLASVPCDAVVIDNERGARDATRTCSSGSPADRRCSSSTPTGRATPAGSQGYRAAHEAAGVPSTSG